MNKIKEKLKNGEVLLICDECQRKVIVPFDDCMPIGTVEIRTICERHTNGIKDPLEFYFDKNGKQITDF